MKKNSLTGFVDYINSKNSKVKYAGTEKGKHPIPNKKLFEISTIALVVGWKPMVICSLEGYNLSVYDKSKKLSAGEMNELYAFIEIKYKMGAFQYIGSHFDFTIIDGNSHSYFINWNNIKAEGGGGHTLSTGLKELVEYCSKLINN